MTDDSVFKNTTALFHSFGCKLNFAETSTVARTFAEAGIRRVQAGETPDFIVVNTCSVTEVADKKCRQAIRSFHRRYPEAAILVTGCYAQRKADEVAALDGVAVVAGSDKKDRLLQFLNDWKEGHEKHTEVTDFREISEFTQSC